MRIDYMQHAGRNATSVSSSCWNAARNTEAIACNPAACNVLTYKSDRINAKVFIDKLKQNLKALQSGMHSMDKRCLDPHCKPETKGSKLIGPKAGFSCYLWQQ